MSLELKIICWFWDQNPGSLSSWEMFYALQNGKFPCTRNSKSGTPRRFLYNAHVRVLDWTNWSLFGGHLARASKLAGSNELSATRDSEKMATWDNYLWAKGNWGLSPYCSDFSTSSKCLGIAIEISSFRTIFFRSFDWTALFQVQSSRNRYGFTVTYPSISPRIMSRKTPSLVVY